MTNFDGRITWQTADAAPPGNYRFFPEYGGGALLDIGVHPLHALLACVPEPNNLEVTASSRHLNEHGADLTTDITLTCGENTTAEITASFEQPATDSMRITFESFELSLGEGDAGLGLLFVERSIDLCSSGAILIPNAVSFRL